MNETILRRVMEDTGLLERWELFEKNELHTFLEKQVAITSTADPKAFVTYLYFHCNSCTGSKPTISCQITAGNGFRSTIIK